MKMSTLFRFAVISVAGLVVPMLSQACATCGCSLSSDAAMGYSATAGWAINLEYDFINQSQLRHGSGSVSSSQVAGINDAGGNQEVEDKTINRYTNLRIMYSPNAAWNIQALVPYIDRSHDTYSSATTNQLTPDNVSGASSDGLGDVKLIGSYQGILPTHNLGVQFGIKLPTGNYGGQNIVTGATIGRHPVFFSSGPSVGEALDTSLNPGTGSTDLILGMYYFKAISQNVDAFVNAQYQWAVSEKLDQMNADFRPGNQATMSFGLRYMENPTWIPQLQINVTDKQHDQGALADTTDTAGKVIYLSPGITVNMQKNLHVYGFIQLPVTSNLQGYQLFPRWTGTLGLGYAF